jgi:hypothetical protein
MGPIDAARADHGDAQSVLPIPPDWAICPRLMSARGIA